MALRSGYYGLKNSVKRALEKLAADMSGAKIIKTIGDGLTFSDAGRLDANIKSIGDGLSLSDAGVLSANAQDTVEDIALTDITVNKGTLDTSKCFIQKCGKVIVMAFRLTDVTASSGDTIITLPDWMKPKTDLMIPVLIGGTVGIKMFRVDSNASDAQIVTIDAISNLSLYICVTSWFIDHEPENNS